MEDQEKKAQGAEMKLRCPHCRAVFPKQNAWVCPSCGKGIHVPDHLRRTPRKIPEQYRARERIVASVPMTGFFARGPRIILVALLVLLVIGVMLIGRSKAPIRLTPADKLKLACSHLLNLGYAVTAFESHNGRFPTTEEGFKALLVNPGVTNWKGPYITLIGKDFFDPWGNPYRYTYAEGHVKLWCYGPDGKDGNEDDLLSPYFIIQPRGLVEDAIDEWKRQNEGVAVSNVVGDAALSNAIDSLEVPDAGEDTAASNNAAAVSAPEPQAEPDAEPAATPGTAPEPAPDAAHGEDNVPPELLPQ